MTPPAWLECLAAASAGVAAAYPTEGCGLILEEAGLCYFQPTANLAPRPRHAYALDPLEFVRAEDRGARVCAIVHSHPDSPPIFSAADAAQALLPDGRAAFPGVDYVVVAVRDGVATRAAVFRFEATGRFSCVWDGPA